MNKTDLKVIRGGLLDNANTSRKTFVSAYVTNTRLMGVLGMYIHFKLPENESLCDLHLFFYFDAEEYGFETYRSVLGQDKQKLQEIEGSLIGGLGGEKMQISLEEAKFLLQEYVRLNRNSHLPMPDGYEEYRFLLEQRAVLSEPEQYILMGKQCTRIDSPFELINYFLMRCFGKDFPAAAFLAVPDLQIDLFPDFKAATLLKNIVDHGKEEDSFISESLVEFGNNYYIAVTSVTVKGSKIKSYERVSSFKVSPSEAALMLARSEYVTVYEVLDDISSFSRNATALTTNAMITKYDSGTLYMIFHPNNKHVNQKEYRLNEDVLGLYFISDGGQLISTAYSHNEIHKLEWDLCKSPYRRKLMPAAKYQFKEPVLYEFIQSGFADFEDFVEAITLDDE